MTRRAPIVTNVTRNGDALNFSVLSPESTRSTTFNKKVR